MATEEHRRLLTEQEVEQIETAFQEYEQTGSTEKSCPWCGQALKFHDGGSGYKIWCSQCTLSATFRGI